MAEPEAGLEYQRAHWNDDTGPSITIGTAVLLAIAVVSVGTRLFAKRYGRLGWEWDDFLMVLALVRRIAMAFVHPR